MVTFLKLCTLTNRRRLSYNMNYKTVIGDVNADGKFHVADVVLLQKWLLAVSDTHLADWKADDLCEDYRLDTFDLCIMRKKLIE